MYASIIPLWHSLGTEALLYTTDMPLRIGSLVEIPYGKNIETGIVAGIFDNFEIDFAKDIKPIGGIVTEKAILAPYQFEMIEAISRRYMIPIHRVLQIFLPRPVLTRLEKKNFETLVENAPKNQQRIIDNQLHILQEGIVTPDVVIAYLKPKTAIIFADDFAMMPYREAWQSREDIYFIDNDMTDTRRAQSWIDISNGKYEIICWPRRLLYYNLAHYEHILYLEDTLATEYWHYPIRIKYTDILRIFADTNSSSITLLTSIPTLSSLSKFHNFTLKNI
jgi:primosomal protein N'